MKSHTRRTLKTGYFLLTVGFSVAALAQPISPVWSGVVQSVDAANRSVVVGGRTIYSNDTSRVVSGQSVNVYGQVSADGIIRGATLESVASYIASIEGVKAPTSQNPGALEAPLAPTMTSNAATHAAAITAGGVQAERITVGGERAQRITVGGERTQAITAGGVQAERITVGGERAQRITVGGARVQ
jgi:hypothetical protein